MRKRCLIIGLVLLAIMSLGIAGLAVAQAWPAVLQVGPTVEKPLADDPFGIQYAIDWVTQAFSAGWYVGVAVLLFLFVNILRGKLQIKGVAFKIPWLSGKFDELSKTWKLVIISGGVTVGMGFYGLTNVIKWEFAEIARCFGSGALAGVMLALMANGVNDAKRSIDDMRATRKKKKATP